MTLEQLRQRVSDWIFTPRIPEESTIELTRRRVYIVPTRHGVMLGAALVAMLLGSINYSLGLGFALTFLLASLAMVSMLYAYRNLAQLEISAGRVEPVFAGETAQFTLLLRDKAERARYAVATGIPGEEPSFWDVSRAGQAPAQVLLAAQRRGVLTLGRVLIFTTYPLGWFYAWSYVRPGMSCLVYPRPARSVPPPPYDGAPNSGVRHADGSGDDDFAGLRDYHLGDSPRHIAWRRAAATGEIRTKQFAATSASEVVLAWDRLPPHLDTEERLSWLTRWVVDCEDAGEHYALHLPGERIPFGRGAAHLRRCLERLARFESR
jgi:uncharacterized protein (DUF58 family)